MDKVIIDGVDVSECKHFYSDEMCDSEQTLSCVCVKNKECEYKQLKQLQAENERLKQEWRLDCLKCEYKNTKADVDKYKQALQEIRDKLDFHKRELEECLYNPIDDEIREIINSVIGAEE